MADVWYKTGQFQTPASGTTVINVTDKGTNPKAIHFWPSSMSSQAVSVDASESGDPYIMVRSYRGVGRLPLNVE